MTKNGSDTHLVPQRGLVLVVVLVLGHARLDVSSPRLVFHAMQRHAFRLAHKRVVCVRPPNPLCFRGDLEVHQQPV